MINKRLISTIAERKKYIAGNVVCQWISLAANIAMMGAIAHLLQGLYKGTAHGGRLAATAVIAALAVAVRYVCAVLSSRMGYLSSKAVKRTLREMIYRKLLLLGTSYKEQANTSEVVQVAVEGVDQLETYFGAYLPQFFYIAGRGMTWKTKIRIMVTVTLLMSVGFIMMHAVPVGRSILACVWAFQIIYFIWGVKTIPAKIPGPAEA